MSEKPLVIDWHGLKRMGWPYSRVHTDRLMKEEITLSKRVGGRGSRAREYWDIPNPDPFPQGRRLGAFPTSRYVWRVKDVLDYFEAHGLPVSDDWQAPK